MILGQLLLALAMVVLAHVFGVALWQGFAVYVDLFLLLALYFSLGRSPNQSAGAGTVVGLTHDALSGGLFGLHGFADTLVAWVAARFQHRVVIRQPLSVALFFALGAGLQMVVTALLQVVLVAGGEIPGVQILWLRMLAAAVLGSVAFIASHRLRAAEQRWRDQRKRRLGFDTPSQERWQERWQERRK